MRYATCILQSPTGVYVIVGSVPAHLARSMFLTESAAIAALLAAGVKRFQLANGVWYDASKENATR